MKKLVIFILCMTTVFTLLCVTTVQAKTVDDAVAWLKAQNGVGYDLDNSYGCQCSDFATAYMNWCVSGNPRSGRYAVVNDNYYPTLAAGDPSNWEVIQNYAEFVPQPGDIFISNGALPEYGHVGMVLSSTVNTATIIDQNFEYKPYGYIHDVTWGKYSYIPTYFIRYKGFNNTSISESMNTTKINNGTYYFKNVATGLYMNLAYGKDVNEQNVHAHEFAGYDSQKMFTWHLGENRYAIRPEGVASRIINANAWNIVPGTNVNLFDDSGDPTQHWYFEKSGNAYIIHNVANYNCVIAVDSDLNVIVENSSGKNNQKWVLECVTHTFDNDSDASCNVCSYVRVINQSAECKHSYDDNGYCEICKEGFPMQVTTTFPVEYKVIKNDTPVRNRPYASDKIVNRLSENTIVTVVKSGLNAQNNLWHGLDDGTWVYDGNLEKVTTEIILKIGNKSAKVNNKQIQNDVAPELKNSRTMLPIRFIAEQLGAAVEWDSNNNTVIIKGNGIDIKIPVGSKKATVNGQSKELDSPAYVESGRTFTPLRFIAEALGAIVDWNGNLQTIVIRK